MESYKKSPKQIWVLLLFLSTYILPAQLPPVDIYTLEGQRIDASTINIESMPMVVVFFKTNEQKCCQQLISICEKREEEFSDKGVRVIGICLDCQGSMAYVKPFILGHDINIDVFIDLNGDLKRTMGINVLPYTVLYDHHKQLVCKYAGFCMSSDDMIEDKLTQCLNKMPQNQ